MCVVELLGVCILPWLEVGISFGFEFDFVELTEGEGGGKGV